MRIGNLTVSKTNIKAISLASTIHIGYLLGTKVCVSASHTQRAVDRQAVNKHEIVQIGKSVIYEI